MALEKFDPHRLALHAATHLTALEENTGSAHLALIQDVRNQFKSGLQELNRKEYYPLQDRFIAADKKGHRPAQVETPHITQNVDLNQLMFLLFERRTNLKGLLYQYYKRSEKYDVKSDFGIQIEPFINKVTLQEIQSVLTSLLPVELDPTNDHAFMDYIEQAIAHIHEMKLTGTHHNFLSRKIRSRRNVAEFRNAAREYVRNMGQYYEKLNRKEPDQKTSVTAVGISNLVAALICTSRINELSHEGTEHLGYQDVLTVYADEIALALGMRVDPASNDDGLDFEFAPKTFDFVDNGTRYGDCTSRNKITQIDEVANIFWTIASYAMDIFHQVQELRIDGDPIMKAHLAPCFFRGEPALNIDAWEATLKIREYLMKNGTKTENKAFDPKMFGRQAEFFEITLQRIRNLADVMGIDRIICDGYSNTPCIRENLKAFPDTIYHISEYHSVYDGEFPKDFAQDLLQLPVIFRTEVQAQNIMLWDQGLRPHYKMNRTIRGTVMNSEGAIRGV